MDSDGYVLVAGTFLILVSVASVGAVGYIFATARRRVREMKTRDYNWYKQQYPAAFKDGRPTCYSCGGKSVVVKNLMQRTFMREHLCVDCGTTLFYSSEASR